MILKRIATYFILLVINTVSVFSQEVHYIFNNIKNEFSHQNYYTVVNLCRNVEKICSEEPVSECYFTNVMKNIYKYKGLAEFEIYKRELKSRRLQNSIESLEISYGLFKDAEILYTYGYLLAIQSILKKQYTNLDGLVSAWRGIVQLYGHNNWTVNRDLIEKIKDYIKITEKYTIPKPSIRYSGSFAKYMIIMACNLAEKGKLNYDDQKIINSYENKYSNNK